MPLTSKRIVKEHDERRREILTTAQELFYGKGYEQTSVREITDAIGIAKGTFYHYFGSKSDLLDELIEGLLAESNDQLQQIVADESLPALAKFQQMFGYLENWKTANRAFVMEMVRLLYRDENILLRTRMRQAALAIMTPILAEIVRQGVAEGVFAVAHPDETAEMVLQMGQGLSESVAYSLLDAGGSGDELLPQLLRKNEAYERGIERVLGAPAGSIQIASTDAYRQWLAT